tara:strand:+ start:440 stop:859 length:420 start_codon:yes stop_codon:yes gene_type:complete
MKEDEILALINQNLEIDLHSTPQFHRLDGLDHHNKICCEIKGRKCNSDKYDTTMIGFDKIQYWKKIYTDYKLLLIFEFLDGIFYYFYDKYEDHKVALGGRCDRGKLEQKHYCFISKTFLNKLCLVNKYDKSKIQTEQSQ